MVTSRCVEEVYILLDGAWTTDKKNVIHFSALFMFHSLTRATSLKVAVSLNVAFSLIIAFSINVIPNF